ncbi:hypothetical protein ACO22_04924 [Paracoccidioides brasiliensis]|uniref:Uncharacterized protein n=1 Tax=Paracoccidioides brasiliensis TaxID=121759 RepID=A0A1D2JBU6_PARBR|nr:hypothetical protein ACO22_04924 [Paracoccidioides brasiliensis]
MDLRLYLSEALGSSLSTPNLSQDSVARKQISELRHNFQINGIPSYKLSPPRFCLPWIPWALPRRRKLAEMNACSPPKFIKPLSDEFE